MYDGRFLYMIRHYFFPQKEGSKEENSIYGYTHRSRSPDFFPFYFFFVLFYDRRRENERGSVGLIIISQVGQQTFSQKDYYSSFTQYVQKYISDGA